ncbi:MAG: TetR/AcrR family transcriptional regulator [Hyphomicrobiaceae bacterium]|nr:MAG: TetR/AcrR family transcriptional regulator [Hyphomicrobiaceae bacterium]
MQKVHKREVLRPVGRWGEREKGILEVATSLYAQGGYETISMATVASAAGLSEGTLYNYFRDKQDLVLRVSVAAFERHTVEAERIVAEARSLRDGLEQLIALELRILIEAKEIYRIWLREVRGSSSYPQSAAREILRRFSSQLIHLFEKWGAIPDARLGISLPLMRDLMFGGLEHVVWTAILHRREDRMNVAQLARDLAGAYLRAVGLDEAGGGGRGPKAQRAHAQPKRRSRKAVRGSPERSRRRPRE